MMEFTKLVNYCQDCVNNIECPTLTIHGTNDLIVPVEATDYVYNSIKSKTNILVNIKKLNHECFVNKKNKEVKETITTFLKKHPKNKKEIIEL